MFGKYVLSLAALVLLIAVVSIHAAPQSKSESVDVQLSNELDDDSLELAEERMHEVLKKVLKFLAEVFKGVAKFCLKGAAKHCKKFWYDPPKLVSCAADYLAGFCQGY